MDKFTEVKTQHFTSIVDELNSLGKEGAAGDYSEPITYAPGVQIILPEGMSDPVALETLSQAFADKKTMIDVVKFDYGYRPWDVANATARVLARRFGITTTRGRAETREVQVGIDQVVYVPWGTLSIPQLKGTITLGAHQTEDGYLVGATTINVPKVNENAARQLNREIAAELAQFSIYRGKAVTSDSTPRFIDPYVTNRDAIVWSASTEAALRGSVLNVIRFTDRARERRVDLNRPVLWYGEPGNGKTETMNIVAQEAVEHGWSFIQCNGTLRDLISTLRFARIQGRHVVAVEDFERLVNDASQQDRTDLLEELDGATSKGSEVLLIATTNFLDDLNTHQAVRRRFFKEIEFGPLDDHGVERLLRRTLGPVAAPDAGNTLRVTDDIPAWREDDGQMDYAAVTRALSGWGNSYIRKVEEFAMSIALEHAETHLTTADLLAAVEAYRPDWEAYCNSTGRPEEKTFENELRELMVDAVRAASES